VVPQGVARSCGTTISIGRTGTGRDARAVQPNVGCGRTSADHIHEAPVWIVPCLAGPRQPGSGSSIYPAVQNMLLATRALGLGTTLTTLYLIHEKETEAAMGLPDTHHSYAILPIGYPLGRFGPVRRAPLSDVVYDDRWGDPWTGA
jgi:nitroreductase